MLQISDGECIKFAPFLPEHLDRACMKLLAKQPQARFQTAEELLQALDQTELLAGGSAFCHFCGKETRGACRYCSHCGAELSADQLDTIRCLACAASVGEASVCPGCSRSFSGADHRLFFRTGPLAGHTFRIPEGDYEVGRNELAPRDYHISRRHLRVSCLNGSIEVQDAGSANKTYVAGQLAQHPIELLSGQQIQLADNVALYTST